MSDLMKKLLAEAIGTFVLVFAACGVAALTGGNLVPTAMAFGLVIVAMAYSVGRVSGCHINPAVSLGCLLTKRMSVTEFLAYCGAQVVGGLVGGIALWGIVKMSGAELADTAASNFVMGGAMNAGSIIGAFLTEIILTCVFVFVILNVTDENSGFGKKAGVIIGFTLTLVPLIGIDLTGTSVNPARSLATALCNLIFNGSADALAQVWIFILAPLAGAACAALLYNVLNKSKSAEE